MTGVLLFVKAHWRAFGVLAFGLGCGGIGYALHSPPPPAVHLEEKEKDTATGSAIADSRRTEGPEKITTTVEEFGGADQPSSEVSKTLLARGSTEAPRQIVKRTVTVDDRGPVVTDTHATEQVQTTQERHLDLTMKPANSPGWAVQVGVEGLQARTLRLAVRRRLFAGLWVEVSAVPAARSLGAAVAFEF